MELWVRLQSVPFAIPLIRSVLILAGFWVGWRFVLRLVARFGRQTLGKLTLQADSVEAQKRTDTLTRILSQVSRFTLLAVALILVLREFGVDIRPLIASVGVLGLAVGFGAQSLVKDVISGFFIILENQIRVGDVASINGTSGVVEGIRLRTTVLRDVHGTVHYFPNGNISTISNLTQGWAGYVMDIGVGYDADLDRTMDLMNEVAEDLRADDAFGPSILQAIEIFGVDAFADSAINIKARIKTRPGDQWKVGREYRRRLKKAFDREGIEIPFPQRVMHLAAGEPNPLKG